MKLSYALSASAMAGALLLSGCSSDNSKTPSESATATPAEQTSPSAAGASASPVASTAVDAAAEDVANVVSAYYEYVASDKAFELIEEVDAANSSGPADNRFQSVLDNHPELSTFFATSEPDLASNAISQVYARATQTGVYSEVTASVPVEAVTVTDSTATVDSSLIEITMNGKTHPATFAPYFELSHINVIKNEAGEWVMIPEPPRQSME